MLPKSRISFVVALAAVLVGACSAQDGLNGPMACGPNGACPAGYTCEATTNICVLSGSGGADATPGPAIDAPVRPDAPSAPDAPPPRPDAPPVDAPPGAPTVAFLPGTTPEDGARTNVAAAHLVFDFTSPVEVGAHLECSDNGAAFAVCTSPVDVTVPIVTGNDPHTFAVRGVGAGGAAGVPAMRSWVLDTVKPVVVISGTPTTGSVTSLKDTQFVLAFSPAEPADSVIECSITGPQGTFTVDACANRTGLADGGYDFAARGRDVAGNVGDPAEVTWTVDSTKPGVVLGGTPTNGADTNDRTTSFTFAFVGNVPGGVLLCKLAGPGTNESFANANCRNRTGLADGSWTFSLQGRDAAGNLSAVASVTWKVDTAGPLVAFGVCTPDDGVVTDSGAVSYKWDFVDAADRTGGHLEFSLDGVSYMPSDGTFTTTVTVDGVFQFWARGVDAAQNPGPSIQRSFTLSTVGPTMTIGGTPVEGGFLRVSKPSFTFTSAAGASFECAIDGAGFAGCTAASVNATDFSEGAHTLTAHARIGQGAAGDPQTVHFTVDTIAPVTTLTSEDPTDGSLSNKKTWTLKFTVDDATAAASCVFDGVAEACTSPATHTFTDDGPHTAFVSATDPAGNPGAPTPTVSYTLDRQQPQIFFDQVPPNGSITFNIKFHSDKTPVTYFACGADGDSGVITKCVTNPDMNSGFSTGNVRNSGTLMHHFSLVVEDDAGNTNVGEVTWTTN